MQFGNRNLTTEQRDRLLARETVLDQIANEYHFNRPAFSKAGPSEERFKAVAKRIRRFVGGVDKKDGSLARFQEATERHITCQTSYDEWIEELRWCGMNAMAGRTKLNPEQAARRQSHIDAIQSQKAA